MCYSEFNAILKWIAAMDADVISIEASRSNMDLLQAFVDFKYPSAIGPGVYDIYSPRVPDLEEILSASNRPYGLSPRKTLGESRLWAQNPGMA